MKHALLLTLLLILSGCGNWNSTEETTQNPCTTCSFYDDPIYGESIACTESSGNTPAQCYGYLGLDIPEGLE